VSRLGRCTTCLQTVKPAKPVKSPKPIRVPRGLAWRFDGIGRNVVPRLARDGEWVVHFLAGPQPPTPGDPEWSVYVGFDAQLGLKSLDIYCVHERGENGRIDNMDSRAHVLDKATQSWLEGRARLVIISAKWICLDGRR